MTAEEVAERFAFARPGYVLVDYGLVGLPYWRTRVRASVQARKPVGPLREFVLRAADADVTAQEEISHLLGLDAGVVLVTVAELVGEGLARLGPGETVQITESGRSMLDDLFELVIEERELTVFFDGLLRTPVGYIGDSAEPRDLKSEAIHEIPPSPARGPDVDAIRDHLPRIQALLARTYPPHEELADILAIKAVDRRERVFKRAIALVYREQHGQDSQVAFAIDGELSSVHEQAFATAGLLKKLGIGKSGIVPARRLAEDVLPRPVVAQLDEDAANLLQAEVRQAQEQVSSDGEVSTLDEAQAALDSLPVRPIATYEHPQYLKDALGQAKSRLLIISPWVRAAVVDHEFAKALEAALDRGVDVRIGWGISQDERAGPDADPRALARLETLAKGYPNLALRRLGDTHAKVLICDRRFVIVTSFNWLSFRGDPKRTFRDEQGTLVTLPEYVDAEYEKFVQRLG
jgi:hypothetical protein